MAAARLALLLLALLPGVAPHPVSNCKARLELRADATVLRIDFTYDDVCLHEGLAGDDEGVYAPDVLRLGLAAFRARVESGTALYDPAGKRLAPDAIALGGIIDPPALGAEGLMATSCSLTFRYPPLATPRECSILLDWEAWRRGVSTSVVCAWSDADGAEGRVLWRERQRYPLLPGEGEERIYFGDEEVTLVGPIEECLTGYSYLYVEADHVRHELVLPLMSIPLLRTPGESAIVATGRIGQEQRDEVSAALRARFGGGRQLAINGEISAPTEVVVRWFTSDSLRRGVVTGDRPIPLATGFVGMLMVHPVDAPVAALALKTGDWAEIVRDQVVSVIVGEQTERFVTGGFDSEVRWEGAAPEAAKAVVAVAVPVGDVFEAGWLSHALLGAFVVLVMIVVALWVRRRRPPVLVGVAGLVVGVSCLFSFWQDGALADDREVLGALIDNMYRAHGRQDERQALELLSVAAEGPLLEQLYLDLQGQLHGPWSTGAGASVEDVKITGCELEERTSREIAARCRWDVAVRIEHWGHVHHRRLEIEARLVARAAEGAWRLAEVVLLDKRITEAASRPRR